MPGHASTSGTCGPIRVLASAPEPADRCSMSLEQRRRVLCVSPRYAPSFGTFSRAYGVMGAKAFMPPLGLLTIAAYLPPHWEVRFIDENVRRVHDGEIAWA